MQICGIARFLTQKLSWSLVNKFPVSSCFKENYVKFSVYINFFRQVILLSMVTIFQSLCRIMNLPIFLSICCIVGAVMVLWQLDLLLPVQTAITTKVVSSNSIHGEVYSIQHDVIKFISNLHQIGGFLQVLWLPPPIKLTATI